MIKNRYILGLGLVSALFVLAAIIVPKPLHAQSNGKNFSLEITPSPLIVTVKPGESRTVDLRIRNNGSQDETLKAELRTFKVDTKTGKVDLGKTTPDEVKDWVSFAQNPFTIPKATFYTQRVRLATPSDVGFSYAFAIVISRSKPEKAVQGKQSLEGSIAIFTLLGIDRPGASRRINIEEFRAARRLYEYLPSTFNLTVKNEGNTFVQPTGNIYISRKAGQDPLAVLPVNATGGYILPGTSRQLSVNWTDGFPVFVEHKEAANAAPTKKLEWNWGKLQHFRFGKYTAQVVAIYNDGKRDVPVIADVSFWVIPWKILLAGLAVLIILGVGIWTLVRRGTKMINFKSGRKLR